MSKHDMRSLMCTCAAADEQPHSHRCPQYKPRTRDAKPSSILPKRCRVSSKWRPMTEQPEKSGYYIVAHRGTMGIAHYSANDFERFPGAVLGWRDFEITFGPTHWMPAPICPKSPDNAFRMWPKPKQLPRKVPVSTLKRFLRSLGITSLQRSY